MLYERQRRILKKAFACRSATARLVGLGGLGDGVTNPRHVVVIAFENRSFDHMLGFTPPGGQLTGAERNPVNPADPGCEEVPVNRLAGPVTLVDPNHSFEGVREQLFGAGLGQPQPAPMNGFVSSYIRDAGGDITQGRSIMACHASETVPVLAGLAQSFGVCTRWFSSVPGPTWPNRFYMHAATSLGLVTNEPLDEHVPTIFDRLDGKQSWRIYAGDVPQCLSVESLGLKFVEEHLEPDADRHFQSLARYFADLTAGSLPAYSFIEPQYFDTPFGRAADAHPPHDVRVGEALLAHVYSALLASSYWQDTLLLVVFDEHGGFFDSIAPPTGVIAPDDHVSIQPAFDFTRLGVRVPAIVVSAWLDPSVDSTQYDHSSIPATLNAVFDLGPASFLTRRDAAANTFNTQLTRTSPRAAADVFQADLSQAPQLDHIAPPAAAISGTRRALEVVLEQKAQTSLSSYSTHQRQLLQLSNTLMRSLK